MKEPGEDVSHLLTDCLVNQQKMLFSTKSLIKEENAIVAVYCEFMEDLGVRALVFSKKKEQVAIFLCECTNKPFSWDAHARLNII